MKTIIICGKQGSGKSRLAANFTKARWQSTTVIKFADPLYAMHNAILPLLESFGLREAGAMEKDGELLQVLGTEYGRKKYGPDVWSQIAKQRAASLAASNYEYALIDDCRFRSEFDAFPNALRVWLDAPEDVRKARASYWRENVMHPSETDLDLYVKEKRFDVVIDTYQNTQEEVLAALFNAIEKRF
jgi:cytidylate kinase